MYSRNKELEKKTGQRLVWASTAYTFLIVVALVLFSLCSIIVAAIVELR